MKFTVHFAVSDDVPIKQGSTATALCGVEVHNIRYGFLWDEQPMGRVSLGIDQEHMKNICHDCDQEIMLKVWEEGRQLTVYGIIDGREARDAKEA